MKLIRKKRRSVLKNPWIQIFQDEAEYPDGRKLSYTVLHYPHPSAGMVVENARGQILLIRSWRYPTGKEGWEIPAGQRNLAKRVLCGDPRGCRRNGDRNSSD